MKRCLVILAMVLAGARGARAAEVERDSLGMAFVKLPAGDFLMGSDEAPASLARAYPQWATRRFAQLDDEGPFHRVRITPAFLMGQHEVTAGQFRRFVEALGSVPESVADRSGGYGWRAEYDPASTSAATPPKAVIPATRGATPALRRATTIRWSRDLERGPGAGRLAEQDRSRRYRLPTEGERAYACLPALPHQCLLVVCVVGSRPLRHLQHSFCRRQSSVCCIDRLNPHPKSGRWNFYKAERWHRTRQPFVQVASATSR